jgi:hypothetical protein
MKKIEKNSTLFLSEILQKLFDCKERDKRLTSKGLS